MVVNFISDDTTMFVILCYNVCYIMMVNFISDGTTMFVILWWLILLVMALQCLLYYDG